LTLLAWSPAFGAAERRAVTDAMLRAAEATGSRALLAEALELAAAIGLPGQEWEIAAELAAAYREGGDSAAAEATLDRSLAALDVLAARIGDERLRERFGAAGAAHTIRCASAGVRDHARGRDASAKSPRRSDDGRACPKMGACRLHREIRPTWL
jgi:hypothetical protein